MILIRILGKKSENYLWNESKFYEYSHRKKRFLEKASTRILARVLERVFVRIKHGIRSETLFKTGKTLGETLCKTVCKTKFTRLFATLSKTLLKALSSERFGDTFNIFDSFCIVHVNCMAREFTCHTSLKLKVPIVYWRIIFLQKVQSTNNDGPVGVPWT